MSKKAVAKRYYPALSDVISADDLPEFLHFAAQGLDSILQNIHYKNLQYSKSYGGDAAFYSLDIISKNIGVDLPFGLRLVLNPDVDGDTSISSFPISIQYQWELLAYLKSFNLQNFAYTPEAFFKLGLQIFRISEAQVIAQTLNYFIESTDGTTDKFLELVADINALYPSANLVLPQNEEPSVDAVAQLIADNPNIPESISEVMFLLYILDEDLSVTKKNLEQFYALMVPDGIEAYISSLLKPKARATLKLTAALEFPPNVLQPVADNGEPVSGRSRFEFGEATFYVDTEAGIGTEVEFGGNLMPKAPVRHQIGNTGLSITFERAKLDLSRTTNIAEADAAGYPVDFMGLYAKEVSIRFMRFGEEDGNRPSATLSAENLFIGTGGVSGLISLESNGLLYRKFDKFAVELNTFSVQFKQNSIISSDIKGKLTINKWNQGGAPAVIDIEAHIRDNGDFTITASPKTALKVISLPNVLDVEITAFELGKEERGFYIEVAGRLSFTAQLPFLGDVLPKQIDVKGFRIWHDGDIEFRGGALPIPKAFRLNIGPVKLEVTNMSLGSYEKKQGNLPPRTYKFVGFDGMINTGTAGVNASGNGIKFYFTNDDGPFDCFISIDRIAIDMTIPGNVNKDDAAFILNGYLSMTNPTIGGDGSTAAQEYMGAVSFTMPRLKMGGSAGMRLTPSVPSFVVDIGMEMSTPIPLGATGLGIYGFRGIIGQHYLPSKGATVPPLGDDASWWDYYKAKSTRTKREGIELDKFASKPGFSVGAGVSIATSFDSGKVLSTKLFLLLGMPDVFLLQGQAGVLRSRIGLSDDVDPPFSALISIDKNSFRGNLGVNFRLPEGGSFDGAIFSLNGALDMAFFFNNASGWYLNVGKDQPESARIRTKILTLFQGYAYLMISSRGFKAGAGARFDFNKKIGPVAIALGASIDLGGSLSFKPVQIGAFIQIGGYAYFKVFFLKFGLSVYIGLSVEAPHPFNILGTLELKFKVPFIGRITFKLELKWRINDDNKPLLEPIPILLPPVKGSPVVPAVATNILTGESFTINHIKDNKSWNSTDSFGTWEYDFGSEDGNMVTIPLDSFIDIELLKPVRPAVTKLGGASNQLPDGYLELLPPQKGLSKQVTHQFNITGLEIYAWKPPGFLKGAWVPYHIYEAVTAIVEANTGANQVNLSELKLGYWQFSEPNRYNKIRLLSQNMFSYANLNTSSSLDLDALNYRRNDLFCFENVTKATIIDWQDEAIDTTYPINLISVIKGGSFQYQSLTAQVKSGQSPEDHVLSMITKQGKAVIKLPKMVTKIDLDFGVNTNNVRIDYVTTIRFPLPFMRPLAIDVVVKSSTINPNQHQAKVGYEDIKKAIDKIVISIQQQNDLDFDGDLVIGGHFPLPDQYISSDNLWPQHEEEQERSVILVSLFKDAVNNNEVASGNYGADLAGQWKMDSIFDSLAANNGIIEGSPNVINGFYDNIAGNQQIQQVYQFSSNTDGLRIPFEKSLKVEDSSFSIEATAIFSPFVSGVSTLLSKVITDPTTGHKKGFALHLYQDSPGDSSVVYTNFEDLPSFSVWLTTYQGTTTSGIKVTEKYTWDCATKKLVEQQYKQILVSVDRETEQINIYIDGILKHVGEIPNQLGSVDPYPTETQLKRLSYYSESQQRRKEENVITKEALLTEVNILGNNLNKTIQPVWRPDTIYAIEVTTADVVNGVPHSNKTIFGFKTAGPLGHFQEENSRYLDLVGKDRAGEFRLANLKGYIDYERSLPDAQGRYDLSKPVFYTEPEIRLFFTKPYINAMFSNWNEYKGLPAIQSRLEIQVLDPFGNSVSPSLVWSQHDTLITMANYQTLPADQQLLFLMNRAAASEDGCSENPISFTKRTKKGVYKLTKDLLPDKLYTALFNSIYKTVNKAEQKAEVHKFSFKTSRFPSFAEQVRLGQLLPIKVSFTDSYIAQSLMVLLDDDQSNDPEIALRYAVKFDRIVYGALALRNLAAVETTVIYNVVNVDTANSNLKRIVGVLIRNPEPFNDPKLPLSELQDTVQMTLTGQNGDVTTDFTYIHSRDTSSIFITNAEMNLNLGVMNFRFKYKLFDGQLYEITESQVGPVQLTNDI